MAFFKIEKEKKAVNLDCSDCGLHLKCKSPKMGVTGNGREKILIIAQSPGALEDETGTHMVGKSGNYLKKECKDIGFDIHEDCWKINAVNCRTPKDREPTNKEIKCCAHMWQDAVKTLKPEKIILLGKTAVESFLMGRTTNIGGIAKWVGHAIPDQDYGCWVFPNYHPAYVLREKSTILDNRFYDILANAYDHEEPFVKDVVNVEIIRDEDSAIRALEKINEDRPELLSFDYESTGIKPHREGHAIRTIAFSYEDGHAVAMPMFLQAEWFNDLLQNILTDPKIKKTAHNMKFEETWTRVKLGYPVASWDWDSMLAAHILDNRGGIASLKPQTYLNFGVIGYDDEVAPYIKGVKKGEDEKSGNRFNRIDEGPIDKILYYNGLDAIYGLKLTKVQQAKIRTDRCLKRGYKLFHKGVLSYVDMEQKGWLVEDDYFDLALKNLNRLDKKSVKKILDSTENFWWKERKGGDINHNSTDQLRELFFDIMKHPIQKKTKTKRASVDAEVLAELSEKSVIASCLISTRKNKGIRDKIKAFQRESVDGIVHPSYNLHMARSYRSSCKNPNMQNNAKRDEMAKKTLRQGVIARPGHYILSRDFSGVEVSAGCFYHKDPEMMKEVTDPDADMHRDSAMKIFKLEREQVTKKIRYHGKNGWVFPEFYGDWYKSCAEGLWQNAKEQNLIEHLADHGIKKYSDFEDHLQDVENWFWKKKFKVYDKWKQKQWNSYQDKGYVEFLTGFRCTDLLDRKQVVNRPIQGTAFHLLVWSQIEIAKEIKDWETSIIGQIHDDLLFDVAENELDDLLVLTDEIETERVRKHWAWINVPLGVESEISKLGGNWYEMEELK